MRKTSSVFLNNACCGKLMGKQDSFVCDVAIDSRQAFDGYMFVCVIGEYNDGHEYAENAYSQGCRVFLMSDELAAEDMVSNHNDASVILADSTIEAFEKMAEAYIGQFELKKLAVTGSVGKTTTKMLTASVMSSVYNTICTQKNLNTNLGLCLTCFLADESTEAIVFEMGMDARNQISEYVSFIKPEIALITNVGISHMERLGSRDAIADAKLEITSKFCAGNTLIVNSESDYLGSEKEIKDRAPGEYEVVLVLAPKDINDKGLDGVEFDYRGQHFNLPLIGTHNVVDACLAIEAGIKCGVTLSQAAEGLSKAVSTERRLKAEKISCFTLLDDSYNASPDSMKAGITALAKAEGQRKIAVLSDMYELGDAEEEGHFEVGRCVAENDIDILIAVGENSSIYSQGVSSVKNGRCTVIELGTNQSAADLLLQIIKEGDVVLVKGSNGTHISQVAEVLREAKI